MRRLTVILATWFGTGFSPFASGTVGTLAAIPLYLLFSRLSLPLYLVLLVPFFLLSCWVAGQAEAIFGEQDSGKIVIDEVMGYLVTMVGIPLSLKGVVAGFFLFRLFDIVKPEPARFFDRRMKNGYGVVLDDVVAGVYACICLHLLQRFL